MEVSNAKPLLLTTFRGKRIMNGEWVIGQYYFHEYANRHIIVAPTGKVTVFPKSVSIRVDGMQDENGRDVFLGDILRVKLPKLDEFLAEVVYEKECSSFQLKRLTDNVLWNLVLSYYFEVIGNVFDNPELLGEKK